MDAHSESVKRLRQTDCVRRLNARLEVLEEQAAHVQCILRDSPTNRRIQELNEQINQYETRALSNDKLLGELEYLEKSVAEADSNCEEIRRSLKLKDSDQKKLNKAKHLLDIGIELTGVRWDFSVSNGSKGYIANKKNDFLKPFDFSEDSNNLVTKLWQCIEEASITDWNDIYADFNKNVIGNSNKEDL